MTNNPFFTVSGPLAAEQLAAQAAGDAEEAERRRKVAACGARPGGHAWQVEGEPGEAPYLSCADCTACGEDIYPDVIDLLYGEVYELAGRAIHFGEELDDESGGFVIPVHVRVEEVRYTSMDCIGYEYDVEVHITDRPAADPKGYPCPTAAGAPCGCCDRCIALQVESLAAEALLGSPSDLDHP